MVSTGAHYTWFWSNNKDLHKGLLKKQRQVRILDAVFWLSVAYFSQFYYQTEQQLVG